MTIKEVSKMSKKPHILFRVLLPIVAFLTGIGFSMIHELATSGGGPTTVELPIDPLDRSFLITSGIVVIIFPLLSRSWISSFLSPLLYFGGLLLSSENFFGLVGLDTLWVFPATFTASGELVLNLGAGICGVGFLSGLVITIIQNKKSLRIKKQKSAPEFKPPAVKEKSGSQTVLNTESEPTDSGDLLGEPCNTNPECGEDLAKPSKTITPDADSDSDSGIREPTFDPELETKPDASIKKENPAPITDTDLTQPSEPEPEPDNTEPEPEPRTN